MIGIRHNPLVATIGMSAQGVCSDIRFCDYRTDALKRGMKPERTPSQEDIVQALRAQKAKQVDIAALLAISPVKVSKAFSGERRFTASETLILLKYLGMLPQAERAPIGDMAPRTTVRNDAGTRMLPVVGLVPAGNWREAIENTTESMPAPDHDLPEDAFVVEIAGDSMDLVAPHGTRVVIDPDDRRLMEGKIYVVRNSDGEVTIKQYKSNPARLVPCSTNVEHREIMLGEEEPGVIVGRAVWRSTRM